LGRQLVLKREVNVQIVLAPRMSFLAQCPQGESPGRKTGNKSIHKASPVSPPNKIDAQRFALRPMLGAPGQQLAVGGLAPRRHVCQITNNPAREGRPQPANALQGTP